MVPWDLADYPSSFKNFDPLLKKKAITIANALVSEGYPDDQAIPIAISQSKKWLEEATDAEKATFNDEPNPEKSDKHDGKKINTELLDNDVLVYFKEDQWVVRTKHAEKAADSFKTKEAAVKRAKAIAENKHSHVITYRKDEQPKI